MNALVTGSNLFPDREIHKLTCCSPNGRDSNQIDHLMINCKWRRSPQDVRVRKGSDVDSNHFLESNTIDSGAMQINCIIIIIIIMSNIACLLCVASYTLLANTKEGKTTKPTSDARAHRLVERIFSPETHDEQ